MSKPMRDLISRADIPYHTQLEPMGNGQYSDVEVAYKTDIDSLPSAEPIERISDNTIVVKYADYEDIGRIILTNGDIFCKMFYEEDARQNDDSDYDSLVPDEYKTEPSDLISRADAIEAVLTYFIPRSHTGERGEHEEDFVRTIFNALPSADAVQGDECDHCVYKWGMKGGAE